MKPIRRRKQRRGGRGLDKSEQFNPPVIQSIKYWISNCDSRHSGTCIISSSSSSIQQKISWLIDVRDRCIVRGAASNEYLALSYTWQNKTSQTNKDAELQLLSNNIELLTKVNALEQYKSNLPKVIINAMELTSAIGKRYLWVDRLCIVQDDPGKASEFSSMDHVYSAACMTIIAAAEYGMFHTPEATIHSPESDSKNPTKAAEVARAHRIRSYYETVCASEWAERAWTYQEYVLSKRVVFFLGTQIFWQCECAVWDSSQLRPQQNDKPSPGILSEVAPMRQLSIPTWPDFSIYADLVCPYNGRQLTYKEDGLSAFLGVLNYLAPAFPKGFLFGLPRLYLDHALLWQPLKGTYLHTWDRENKADRENEPIELIAISQGSAKGKCLRNCYEEKVLRRSRYADPRPFHAVYDRAGRWVGHKMLGTGYHYQVIATGQYEENLELPDYEDDQEYQFYNVLWVQRGDNDVAYRAGCGRVLAEAWEKSNPENIRVTLG
ncbi:heterokaryon incompatibility domain-containing protein [Trichoderma camerunense]